MKVVQRSAVSRKTNCGSKVSVLSYFWNIAEDVVLEVWVGKLRGLRPKHLSLHVDGVRVDRSLMVPSVDAVCKDCMQHIEKMTGFKVVMRPKQHRTMFQAIKHRGASSQVECSPVLLRGELHSSFSQSSRI